MKKGGDKSGETVPLSTKKTKMHCIYIYIYTACPVWTPSSPRPAICIIDCTGINCTVLPTVLYYPRSTVSMLETPFLLRMKTDSSLLPLCKMRLKFEYLSKF